MAGPGSPDNQPLKLVGYGLLGVAAIAAVIGLVNLASGGSEAAPADPALQAPPSSVSAAPPAETAPVVPAPVPTPEPAPATGSGTAAALPGAGLPGAGLPGAGGGSANRNRAAAAKAPVRVYNNSTISGLADRAADDIRDSGWTVTDVGNWPYSTIPSSTVYYRAGTSEQAAARNLADSFGLRSEARFDGISGASPGLIVIITKDYQRR